MASGLRSSGPMARDRCILCDRIIFEGDDVTRPPTLGVRVHRHCYLREAGLEDHEQPPRRHDPHHDTRRAPDPPGW